MKQMTVCFLLQRTPAMEVLLGYKKIGFGAGKYAGIGGKVEPDETVEAAAIREVEEEIGVLISEGNLRNMGKVIFSFPSKTEWSQEVSIFIVLEWQGEPRESDEMRPSWFSLDRVPYESMWQDARHWIPLILDGCGIEAMISFKTDLETVQEVAIQRIMPDQAR